MRMLNQRLGKEPFLQVKLNTLFYLLIILFIKDLLLTVVKIVVHSMVTSVFVMSFLKKQNRNILKCNF